MIFKYDFFRKRITELILSVNFIFYFYFYLGRTANKLVGPHVTAMWGDALALLTSIN